MGGTLGLVWILVAALALFLPSGCGDDDGGTGPQGDTVPPAAVTDLSVASTTDSSATLTWTAPGDDGTAGTATEYDIRYSSASLTEAVWSAATQVDSVPAPKAAGTRETLVVTGLTSKDTVYFALKTADEIPNWSGLSNVANDATLAEPPPGMVLVPAGTFIMGDGQAYCGVDEHQVTLTHAFYIAQYEVTNQQYRDALQWAYSQGYVTATSSSVEDNLDGSTAKLIELDDSDCEISFSGSTFTVESGSENHPVVEVSWYGAVVYCDWLSVQEGLPRAYGHSTWQCNGGDPYGATGYRLPFIKEKYMKRVYPWGDEEPACSRANCGPYPENCVGWTSPVGSYPAAPASLGLYDMAGNVMEWCNDWYTCDLGTAAQTNPPGPGTGSIRVLRGGSWSDSDWSHLRCAYRLANDPSRTTQNHGFRCVRSQ